MILSKSGKIQKSGKILKIGHLPENRVILGALPGNKFNPKIAKQKQKGFANPVCLLGQPDT
jgi:hypothetical protein